MSRLEIPPVRGKGDNTTSLRRASVYNRKPSPSNSQTNLHEYNTASINNESRRPSIPSQQALQHKPRRPSQPYRPPSNPTTPPAIANTPSGPLDRRKSRVDAQLLKKRQSISYAQAEAQNMLPSSRMPLPPAVPAMPNFTNMPTQVSDERIPLVSTKKSSSGFNLEDLDTEMFDADTYIKRFVSRGSSKSNLEQLKALKATLKSSLDVTAQDLQQSVLTNYADFVTVSKELSALEVEMLELRGVLEEWRGMPNSLELPVDDIALSSSLSASGGRRSHRNSIADLAMVYRNQLEALWENVEGSQNLLPPVPGRHLIAESAAFTELNSATYKPRGQVHLFLLNDSMMIATRRRRQMGSKVKLVADKCFTLNEIVVVDLKDSKELANAIKIKRNKEIFVFCAEKPDDKRGLLAAFKKVAEEMITKKRKQSIWEAESRRDGDLGGTPYSASMPDTPSSFNPAAHFGLGESANKEQAWVNEISDELSVATAVREFDSAIEIVLRGKAALSKIKDDTALVTLFKAKLDTRTNTLIAAILTDLHAATLGKMTAIRCATWLAKLGETDRARETFLDGRSLLVKKRVKQIKFEGDITAYIGELAIVVFTLIKNTCEWYMAAFKDNRMASGFVKWATQQIELFSSMFGRQVQGIDQDGQITTDAFTVTKTHALMLRDVGLDFGFMFDQLASPRSKSVHQSL